MLGTVVNTPQSSTGVQRASPMVTTPTARLNRRSAPPSPTTPPSTRSGSKASKAHIPSKQSVTAALAMVRARKASSSPKISPRDENGMTKPANAVWSDSLSPTSKANRLPLTPKMQSSPKEQLSSTPMKLPASPLPSSPRSQASPVSSVRSFDNRSPHGKFFFNSFASRAHAPPLPALSIITLDQENEGSDVDSPANLSVSSRRSRRAAVYRSRLNPRIPRSHRLCTTLDSPKSRVLVTGSPSPDPPGMSCVIKKTISEEEADTPDWHSAKEDGSVDSRSDAESSSLSEYRLDPAIQRSLNNFIDRLNDKEVEGCPEDPAIVAILSSSDDVASVDPETLNEIASFIDLVSKKPPADQVEADDDNEEENDSSFDDEVPAETRAGIDAFIESLEKKAQTPRSSGNEKDTKAKALRVYSSDEDVIAARDIIMKAKLSLSANDKIAPNRSDPFASPNLSILAGEHLLQPGSSKVSAEDEANKSTDEVENERNLKEGTSHNVACFDLSKSEENNLFAGTLSTTARKVVDGVGDSNQHTEINSETIEISEESNSREGNVFDTANAIASFNLTDMLAKADEKREQDQNCDCTNVSEDETSYMRNAFLIGSDMDLSIDPILYDPSTMKSIDEDDNIERFLARTFTLPEGATKEDLTILNSFVRQAGNMMQNGSTKEERESLIRYAIRDGVPKDVTQEIFMWLASALEEDDSAQETKSTDEEETFDRFLRETLAGEVEEPCVEEEVGTDVLRINDTYIEICDTFERFNCESKSNGAEQSCEEELGSDMLTIHEDSIEISHSFVNNLNTGDARSTSCDDEASYLFESFVVGSDVDADVASRQKDTQQAQELIEQPKADKHSDAGIEFSDSFLAASLSSTLSSTEKENDEESYLFNAFVMGSDMDLSVDPIVPDPSTMKSIDEDDNIERFLARTFTLPEGAAKEDLVTLNSYIRQAGNMMQNGSTPEEREALVISAIRHDVPKDIIEEIVLWLASGPENCDATPTKSDDEEIADEENADDKYKGRDIFAYPTLSEPSTSTSTTDFMNEQVASLVAKMTADKTDTSTEGIFADPTLSKPSTITSTTDFMNEQVESLVPKTTTDKADTSTKGIFDDPTLSEPSTSTSRTDFMNEQVESLLEQTTPDKTVTSTEGRTISLMDSFIDKLALREGASAEEMQHLNKFMKLAVPVLSGRSLSDEEEVEIRRAAKSVGISVNVMDEVLSENASLKLSPSGRTSACTATRDLPILLADSSINDSQDQTLDVSFDIGHSDMKKQVVADAEREGEEAKGQARLAEDTNGSNVFPEQQPPLILKSTFDDPAGPSKSERPVENEQRFEDRQAWFVDDTNETNPVHKGVVSEQQPLHGSHNTTYDHDGPSKPSRPDENEQHIENLEKEDEAQTFVTEEGEEMEGWGFDYSVDKNALPLQQCTLDKVTTVNDEGPLSPTVDRYEVPLTPVNGTKKRTTASFIASLTVNILETKVVMPQESGALAANLPAPPPPFSPPLTFSPTRVPQGNERYALPPTPVSQIGEKIVGANLPAPPPPLSPPLVSSTLRVVVPQGSESYALPPTPASLTEEKTVAVNLPTSPLSSFPASPMTRGHESERYALLPTPLSRVEENALSVHLPPPLSPFPASPILRGQERECYALSPTPASHIKEKTVAVSRTASPPPSSPPPSSPKMRIIFPQSERYEVPPAPVSQMEKNHVVEARAVKSTPPSSPKRRVAYAVYLMGHHTSQLPSRNSKAPILSTEPSLLTGGSAAAAIVMWSPRTRKGRLHIPITQQWKLSYKERTKNHLGYFNVDERSLHNTSSVVATPHELDDVPWEDREVKQRFLHEHSLSFSRNWFGNLSCRRGNDRYREPVCHPQSMKMPMTRLPERDWEKEWYLTWQSQKLSHLAQTFDSSSSHASSGYSSASSDEDDPTGSILSGSLLSRSLISSVLSRDTRDSGRDDDEEESESEDGSWCDDEDAPECGYIVNVKQKIGERVSRIHPEHTSSLRRSRWRKKHFPRGTFPY